MSRRINAKRFSQVMRRLAKVPSQISAVVAVDIKKEIMRSMDAGMDPYGKAWPLKVDGDRSKLEKTGAGRRSIQVKPMSGAGIRITVDVLYMIYHQFGGKSHLRGKNRKHFGRDKDRSPARGKPPQRMYIPFDTIPRTWGEIVLAHLEAQAQKVIDRG